MKDYNVRHRVGDTIVDEAIVSARNALQAAQKFAKAPNRQMRVELEHADTEGAAKTWTVVDMGGMSNGALLVV